MPIIGLVLFGVLTGAAAQLLLGPSRKSIDWAIAIACGLAGSFVGGLLISLIRGRPHVAPLGLHRFAGRSNHVTAGWQWWAGRAKQTSWAGARPRSSECLVPCR